MKITLPDFMHSKFLLIIPSVLVVLLIYPFNINTCLSFDRNYNVCEGETDGPGMQLYHISKGFFRDNYGYSMLYSMMTSVIYVPYIWVRTSVLPPYDLNTLDKQLPSLKSELTIILRCMNLAAALGILLISFYLTWLFCKTTLPPFLVSLMIVLNFNLMHHSTLTYQESLSIFFVMLSVLFFVKSIFGKTKTFFWFSGFMVIAALAISCHARMIGYYLLSGPFLIYKFYETCRISKRPAGQTILLIFTGLSIGFFVICLVNSVFISGFKPVFTYLWYKSDHVNVSSARFSSIWQFIDIQFRCQRHSLWLTIWTLGGVVPLFSLCGLWAVCKKRFVPAITLLLFPIGYQILSIGMPGSVIGRYILGQTIFATLYAGLGIAWCVEHARKAGKMIWFWSLVLVALLSQLFFVVTFTFADNYYNPYRVIEHIINDPANNGKTIIVRGIQRAAVFSCKNNTICEVIIRNDPNNRGKKIVVRGIQKAAGFSCKNNTICEVILGDEKGCEKRVTITILGSRFGFAHGNLCKKEVRNIPAWFVFLAGPRGVYSSIRICPITIKWYDDIH